MKRCLSVPCTVLSACLIALAPALVADTAPARISVLIVDGQNNHDWRADTPVLRGILEDTGRFTVEIATSPEQGEDMSGFSPEFRLYDAVLMNYNGDAWPETTRRAWTDYVRNGGGAVFVHAADNAFADWPEWNRMIGIGGWGGRDAGSGPYVYWENGRTVIDPSDGPTSGHGRIHDFEVVVRDAAHPITAGLPECWLHRQDELYHYLRGPATDLTLLATAYSDPETGGTGRHEPVLLVTEFGRGRAFHTMLGHDGKAMAGIGFQTTLARGTEWAATGTVTLPVPTDFPAVLKPLEALRLYTETSPREPLIQLETELYALAGDTGSLAEYEQAFLPILTSPETSAAARRFVCLHLAWMGTNRSVPALAGLLAEPGETRNHAIYALSDIPGPEADAALLNGLTMADTDAQKAVINAIGQRRIRGSAPLLRLCLKEPPLAALALRALAKLGTVEAFSVLEDDTRWKRDPAAAEALLSCAHALDPVPDDITRPLQRAVRYLATRRHVSIPLRYSALNLLYGLDSEKAVDLTVDWLKGRHGDERGLAPSLLRPPERAEVLLPLLLEDLDRLELSVQQATAAAACEHRFTPAASVLTRLALDPDAEPASREIAVHALGQLPATHGAVRALIDLAVAADPSDLNRIAVTALATVPGKVADELLVNGIDHGSADTRRVCLQAVGTRRLRSAVPDLLRLAGTSPDHETREEALKALRDMAGPEEYAPLLALVADNSDAGVRKEAVSTLIRVVRGIDSLEERVTPYLNALRRGDLETRIALVSGLPDLGGAEALQTLAGFGRDEDDELRDAAVRALTRWQGQEAIDPCLELARDTENRIHRVLLMRAFSRLLTQEGGLPRDRQLELCRAALEIGLETEAQRMLIQTIGDIPTQEALELLGRIAETPGLAEDAERAMGEIKFAMLMDPMLTASHNPAALDLAVDGDPGTRWSTGAAMEPGMWVEVDLGTAVEVQRVHVDTVASPDDCPHGLEIYVSDRPGTVNDPVRVLDEGAALLDIAISPPVTGRYVRLVQTGHAPDLWWSIHELRIDVDPGLPAIPVPECPLKDVLADGGWVTRWDLSGPFSRKGVDGTGLFDTVFPPERDQSLTMWRNVDGDVGDQGMINLKTMLPLDHQAVYLRTSVSVTEEVPITLGIGSDDGARIWINGDQVFAKNAMRPHRAEEDSADASLRVGANQILVKVTQGAGDWAFSLRISPRETP